mgnify:CR=1 FL=1
MSRLPVFEFAGIIHSLRVMEAWHLRGYGDLPAYHLLLGLLRVSGGSVAHVAAASVFVRFAGFRRVIDIKKVVSDLLTT